MCVSPRYCFCRPSECLDLGIRTLRFGNAPPPNPISQEEPSTLRILPTDMVSKRTCASRRSGLETTLSPQDLLPAR